MCYHTGMLIEIMKLACIELCICTFEAINNGIIYSFCELSYTFPSQCIAPKYV